jgi:hypothetical protein
LFFFFFFFSFRLFNCDLINATTSALTRQNGAGQMHHPARKEFEKEAITSTLTHVNSAGKNKKPATSQGLDARDKNRFAKSVATLLHSVWLTQANL